MKLPAGTILGLSTLVGLAIALWGGCHFLSAGDPRASGPYAEASGLNTGNGTQVQRLREDAQEPTEGAARAEVAVLASTPPAGAGENEIQVLLYDAETGQRLKQGTILFSSEPHGLDLREPPDLSNRFVVRNGLIPDLIQLEADDVLLWATSSEYEWKSVSARTESTVVVIPLRPVGDLELAVGRWSPWCVDATGDIVISVQSNGRLITPSAYDDVVMTRGNESFDFRDVPVGSYSVAVRSSGPFGAGQTLSVHDALVVKGESTVIEVELADSLPLGASLTVIASAVGGQVIGPKGVFDIVSLYSMDQETLAFVGSDHHVTWEKSAGGDSWEHVYHCLEPGTYRVVLAPIGLSQEVILREGSSTAVVFELDNLASIAVEVERCLLSDSATYVNWGYMAQPRRLHQSISLPGNGVNNLLGNVTKVHLDCVAEPLWIQILGRTTCSSPKIVTPTLREEQIVRMTCDLVRTSVIEVAVMPGALELPASEFWMSLDAVARDHEGSLQLVCPTGKAEEARGIYPPGTIFGTLVFDSPGPYYVTCVTSSGQTRGVEGTAGEANVGLLEIAWE